MPLYNYICQDCENIQTDLRDYDNRDEQGECKACGGKTSRTMQGMTFGVARASYPDGTTKRFDPIRRAEELKRAGNRARAKGDKETMKLVRKERKRLKGE